MKNNFIINLGFIPFEVMVSIDETDESLVKKLRSLEGTKDDYSELTNMSKLTSGRCVMLPSGVTVIRLIKQKNMNDFIGVISHESFHATSFILEKIGVTMETMISDEVYAYMIGFIVKNILNNVDKY